jgi:hypothetical protein
VSSFARGSRNVRVSASADGRTLASQTLAISEGERAHLSFEVAPDAGVIEIAIEADALAIDDRALLAPPASKTVALASTLEADELHTLGLSESGERNIARWLAVVPQSIDAGSIDAAHLVLSRGVRAGAASWCFALEAQGEKRSDLIGPFLGERGHALLEGTTLEGVVWSIDPELVLPGAPLVTAGNDPILTEEREGERVIWHANFDPARSSLQRSPDWPILLANMAELRRAALPGPERTNLNVGESFVYRPGTESAHLAPDQTARYSLEGPLGTPQSATREIPALEQVVVDGLEQPGLYRLSFAGAEVARFALSFADAAESDLRAMLPGRREAELRSSRLEADVSWIELALIALTLTLVGLDWFVLQRTGARFATRS